MLKLFRLTAPFASALAFIPLVANSYPAVPNPEVSSLLCYLQTTDGRIFNLTSLCGKSHPNSNVKVNREPNIAVSSLSYNGNLLVGQVTNQTGQPVSAVSVNYSVLDTQGKEIDAGWLQTKTASPLAPGESSTLQQVSASPGATVKVTSVDWQY